MGNSGTKDSQVEYVDEEKNSRLAMAGVDSAADQQLPAPAVGGGG